MKFAAIITHPIQHFSPIFRSLAAKEGVEVKAFYFCDHGVKESYDAGFGRSFAWDVPLTDGHDHVFLKPGFALAEASFLSVDYPDLASELDKFQPDVLWIHGYAYRYCWRAVAWARRNGSKTVYFGDSELLHHRSLKARALKRLILPWFFSRIDAFLTAGDNNEDYYRFYGVSEKKFYRSACPIDVGRFTLDAGTLGEFRQSVRAELGIPMNAQVVLFSGKLQDYKRPQDLVQSLAQVASPDIHVIFIGVGPLLDDLQQQAKSLGLASRIHFPGFINQADIPKFLAAGDITAVTSSQDAHPLAVSESLPYGMPIIASDRVGCVGPTDTARPGENTLVYPCGDVTALASAIDKLAGDPELRQRFGTKSQEIAPTQDVSVTVDTVLRIGRDFGLMANQ